MIIYNGHRGLTEAEFFAEDWTTVYREGDAIPDAILRDVFGQVAVERCKRDLVTPLLKGKEWLFEQTCKYQPRTGKLLMEGGPLFLRHTLIDFKRDRYLLKLGLEVQGKVVLMARDFWNGNPSDPDYKCSGRNNRGSLPEGVSKAYYSRFDGLNIPPEPTTGIRSYLLPREITNWSPVDRCLEDFRGAKKKYLPWFDEHFPHLKPKFKKDPRYGFREILNTRPFVDPYGEKPQHKAEVESLFVKHDPPDKIVYYVKDGKLDEMRILENPEDVYDRYCEHILLNKTTKFDFFE